jgi:hypothetical protein
VTKLNTIYYETQGRDYALATVKTAHPLARTNSPAARSWQQKAWDHGYETGMQALHHGTCNALVGHAPAIALEIGNMNLEQFLTAYIVAALWSTHDESTESGGEPLENNYNLTDLAPETLASMRADCAAFLRDNADDLALYAEQQPGNEQYTAADLAGHDFWLTRNGHGTGFWDRGLGVLGGRLSAAASTYPDVALYVGDDGKIHA